MARELQPGQRRFSAATLGADLLLLAWFVFSLFPLVWLVLLSLKTEAQQISTYFTFTPTLHNFVTVLSSDGTRLTSVNFSGALLTSVLNCAGAVLVSLVIGVPAAYAAGRWQYRGSNDVMFTILFVIYNQIGLFDTNVGMIWVLQLVTMPLIVWILRSYFQDLPAELEQAALLDGYTRTRAFLMVALPLVRPGIAASALLAFIFAWNNYVFPLILTGSQHTPVTVAVTRFLGGGGQAFYSLTAAAAIIAALPPLLVALSIQRYLVRGLSFGAVKA
jgi:multiple sugar transport system permease protein